jgi:hypothetical protein
MSKQKKKRNKVYTGANAAITKPIITRISAVNRSKPGQWWFDRKSTIKPLLKVTGIAFVIIVIVIEIINIINGGLI